MFDFYIVTLSQPTFKKERNNNLFVYILTFAYDFKQTQVVYKEYVLFTTLSFTLVPLLVY